MKRHLLNGLAVLSAALFVALLLAWAETPWGHGRTSQRRAMLGRHAYFLAAQGNGLRLVRQQGGGSGHPDIVVSPGRLGCWEIGGPGGGTYMTTRFGPEEPRRSLLGFGWDRREYTTTVFHYAPTPRRGIYMMEYAVLALPYWALLLAAAVLPALRVRAWLRRRGRELLGHCPECGYDLRATPDAGGGTLLLRCPECGTPTAEEAEPPAAGRPARWPRAPRPGRPASADDVPA